MLEANFILGFILNPHTLHLSEGTVLKYINKKTHPNKQETEIYKRRESR